MSESQIPCLDISGEALRLPEKSEAWNELANKVREACEKQGCFFVKFDSGEPHKEFFTALETLFNLPEDTKKKYSCLGGTPSFRRYGHTSSVSEHFGIVDAEREEIVRTFTTLMWPDDHIQSNHFCEILNNMSSEMLEFTMFILKVVFKSFGVEDNNDLLEKYYMSHFRLMKYEVPSSDETNIDVGLGAHTDKGFITILCDNGVQGLEILSENDGKWNEVPIPDQCFIVLIGDSFKAWSNGRLHSVKHKVIARAGKTRYSCALLLPPKDDKIVEVSKMFIDEDHPLRYRSYMYYDFLKFYVSSNYDDEALELFAGV